MKQTVKKVLSKAKYFCMLFTLVLLNNPVYADLKDIINTNQVDSVAGDFWSVLMYGIKTITPFGVVGGVVYVLWSNLGKEKEERSSKSFIFQLGLVLVIGLLLYSLEDIMAMFNFR